MTRCPVCEEMQFKGYDNACTLHGGSPMTATEVIMREEYEIRGDTWVSKPGLFWPTIKITAREALKRWPAK